MIGFAPSNLARGARKFLVDVDQAELKKMEAFADFQLRADAGEFVNAVLQRQPEFRSIQQHRRNERNHWMNTIRDWHVRYPAMLPEHRAASGRVSTYALCDALSEALVGDDIVVLTSSGAAIGVFFMSFRAKRGQRIFHNKGTGAMGMALPASIGACCGSGNRRTICVEADGSFQLNVQELATIAHNRLPIKIFVLNNDGYASIRRSQSRHFGRLVGADKSSGLGLPDVCRVAEAYGLPTRRIADASQLAAGVREALDAPGPIVCDVWILPDEPYAPTLSSFQRPDGSMASRPLEDLWPFLPRDEFASNMIVPILPDD